MQKGLIHAAVKQFYRLPAWYEPVCLPCFHKSLLAIWIEYQQHQEDHTDLRHPFLVLLK